MTGKLTFVGLGLGPLGVSLEGIRAIQEADRDYLEYYTTPHEPSLLAELEKASGRTLTIIDRGFVEDGEAILEEARKARIVLIVPGDPMIATTHNDLRVRAAKLGIETALVHAATIASAAASASGLHYYKFGRSITVTQETVGTLQQAYRVVHTNLREGLHTLLLLEFDVERGIGVGPQSAIQGLLSAEKNFKRNVISDDSFALVLSRIGRRDAELKAGRLTDLRLADHGEHPHCVIIPAKLHFTEEESVNVIFSPEEGTMRDNGAGVRRTAQVLIPRYREKTAKALDSVRPSLTEEHRSLVENVELYMQDAARFLAEDDDDLAMLNMGYAEGLLDSLQFTGKANIDW